MEAVAVACLLAPGFEDSEYQIPADKFRKAGFRVDVIGAKAGEELKGDKGRVSVKTDKGIGDVRPQDYQLLFIPGGHSPDKLRADQRFVQFVKDFDRTGRPVAAVCHGPQLLAAAHLVKGRTLTAWSTIQDDLTQMGAHVEDKSVVVDGNWITSRKPDDLEQFCDAIFKMLETRRTSTGAQAAPAPN